MTPDDVRAIVARVAAAYPGTRYELTRDDRGWVVWVGAITGAGETPRAAALQMVSDLAQARAACSRCDRLDPTLRERAEGICDALSEAFEALGGDWSQAQ